VVPPAVLQFRKWLTIWADEPAKLKDANEKKRYAAILEHGLKRKLKNQGSGPAIKPDWKVALEKELKDQGVAPLSKTGLAATQRARRANRSVDQKTADNVKESEGQKARRANWLVEQKKMKPDWKVALEKELKDQGVAPLSKTGLAATQRARRASRSVEQKTADNVREAASQKARRANRSVEQKTADNVRAAATQKAAYWAAQNGVRCAWLGRCVCCRQQTERQRQQQ
jgi:hypothetical protein